MAASNILTFICTLLLISFIASFFRRVHNAGNTVGSVYSAAAIIFMQCGEKLLFYRAGSIIFYILHTFFVITLYFIIINLIIIFLPFFRRYKNKSDVIVIPGCRVKNKKPTKMLMKRIKRAYKEYQKNPQSIIMASGGQGKDEDISEAECIKITLIKLGVPENKIFIEDKSTNTYENFLFTYNKLKEMTDNFIFGRPYDSFNFHFIKIATNEFHMYRSMKTADSIGFSSSPAPCRTTFYLLPSFLAREILAVTYYEIKNTINLIKQFK